MNNNHATDRPDRPAYAAAALESRRSPARVLLVVADAATNGIDLELIDDELIAHGSGPCSLRTPDRGAVTVLARVAVRYVAHGARGKPASEVNLAVTWAVVDERVGPVLDVAGTAYMFHPGELRPEEFRARRRDPFNIFDRPELDRPPDIGPTLDTDAPRQRRSPRRGWAAPRRPGFPRRTPHPRLASVGVDTVGSVASLRA